VLGELLEAEEAPTEEPEEEELEESEDPEEPELDEPLSLELGGATLTEGLDSEETKRPVVLIDESIEIGC
jgi:hypothetical protein